MELDVLKEQLQAFVKQHKLPNNEMPTAKQLQQAGRQDLLNAVKQLGGARKLSEDPKFPMTTVRRKSKSARSLDFTIQAVQRFMEQQKLPAHQMPSCQELRQYNLLKDIYRHGGPQKVADHMSLQMKPPGRPKRTSRDDKYNQIEEVAKGCVSTIHLSAMERCPLMMSSKGRVRVGTSPKLCVSMAQTRFQ